MILLKVPCAIRFKFLFYIARYIVINTAKRKQFKDDDVTKAFYKVMNNAWNGKMIVNIARLTNIVS